MQVGERTDFAREAVEVIDMGLFSTWAQVVPSQEISTWTVAVPAEVIAWNVRAGLPLAATVSGEAPVVVSGEGVNVPPGQDFGAAHSGVANRIRRMASFIG